MNKNLLWIALALFAGIVAVSVITNKSEKKPASVPTKPVQEFVPIGPQPEPKPEPKPEPEKPKWPDLTKWEGTWHTEKNSHHPALDGKLMCDANLTGDGKWNGKFYGDWRGQRFSYDIEWEGPPEAVTGKADIDGADYRWSGKMTDTDFIGTFESNRYIGNFSMKRK